MMNQTAIKKVMLISPANSFLVYGLRLVSSYLKQHGIETVMVFLPIYTELYHQFFSRNPTSYPEKIVKQVCDLAHDCDAIGISMVTMDKDRVISLTRQLKELGKPIMLGGVHPTVNPEDALTMTGLINIGEGFDSLVEFCLSPERSDVRNIWQADKDGTTVRNSVRPAFENIDKIPFPDYDFKTHFILRGDRVIRINKTIQEDLIGLVYHQFASMGCPFSCTYCVNNKYKKIDPSLQRFRFHSADYIIREIKQGVSISSKIEYINFPDDGFMAMDEETIEEFATRYGREIGLPFSVMGIIPEYLTKRKMDLLVSAGLKRVRVGFQSANIDTLRLYKRSPNIAQFVKVNDILQDYHTLTFPYYDVILDNPFINCQKDTFETIDVLKRLKGRFTLFLYSLRPFPGTDLYEMSLNLKLPEHNYKDSFLDLDNTLLNYITTIIQCSQNKLLIEFYLRIYHRFGNIRIPKFLFILNRLIWMARCGIEHFRKRDLYGLPTIFVRFLKKVRSPVLKNSLSKVA